MTTSARRRSVALLALTTAAAAIGGIAGADGPGLADAVRDRPQAVVTPRSVAPTDAGDLVAASFDQLPAPDAVDARANREAREDLLPRSPEALERAGRVAAEPEPEPEPEPEASEAWTVVASWYGPNFHGRTTANGETFDQWAMTAAHKTLPFGTVLRVTNPANGRSVEVRINDRGPFIAGRSLDLSRAAAEALGIGGVASVELATL